MKKSKKIDEEAFVRELWKEMKTQAKQNPSLGLLHERLGNQLELIGLTGGIASGKTTVAAFFQEAGIPVIDADQVARDVVKPGKPSYRKIIKHFGRDILSTDKQIDREKLGFVVFGDEAQRKILEGFTHPEIFKEINKRVSAYKKKKVARVIIDAALLFESGLSQNMHRIILVRLTPTLQAERLMKRSNLASLHASQRIASQTPQEEKEKLADFVIDNSGTVEEAKKQVEEIIRRLHGTGAEIRRERP